MPAPIVPKEPRKAEGLALTLTFDAADGREPLEFDLEVGDKEVITVGRAPKSDVVCTLSGISWHHLELKLADPDLWDGGVPHMVLRDLSMNGTGIRAKGESTAQKMKKEGEVRVTDGMTVCFPMKKPKAKGKEDGKDVVQQIFTLNVEQLLPSPAESPAPGQRSQAATQQGGEPPHKKRAVQLPNGSISTAATAAPMSEACRNRVTKGEALVRSARHAESRGRLAEAFDQYRRGLQHMIKALPMLEKDDAQVGAISTMLKDNLERAALVKERQGRLKLAEIELP
eukprot:TRINITY_DN27877_c0_g1_i1.p1 TRINITY_DN27877_c0_g1~~TRINITY_DN27877_c0_g1_i1.p1  ORF type:complete len:284 (+),score=67.29 TRINITY_DN27877_c0_g1_i1:40-891(+)